MKSKKIIKNPYFVGRQFEWQRLRNLVSKKRSAIIVVYGRRRVGKTELIEQCLRNDNILKFEGIEGQAEHYQRQQVMRQLASYVGDNSIASLKFDTWGEVFEFMGRYLIKGRWTLFLEELQWMANYNATLIAELKHVWDNQLRFNPQLLLVLCGSAPSFMVGKVLQSNALYNRSTVEIPLEPFSLVETTEYMGAKYNTQDIMDAYLSVGGIPEYLSYLKQASSVFLSLCHNAFAQGGFFVSERDRVFVSSLAKNKHYAKIVDYLSKQRYATRAQIAAYLKIAAGGSLSALLNDLEQCGFIEKYAPYHLGENSKLSRYTLQDHYLQFYYKFIQPKRAAIKRGDFNQTPLSALPNSAYVTWLGYAFERYCRHQQRLLAKILGFGSVEFKAGAYFSRATENEQAGFQIDLLFDRKDHVFTVCEIKYTRSPVTSKVITEFERKLLLFPNPKQRLIHKVLISAVGADRSLTESGYFDQIITLADIIQAGKTIEFKT